MNTNITLMTDSYKPTQWPQYPPGTEKVYSYFESRGGQFQETVFFGLQYLLMKYLCGKPGEAFGHRITAADVAEAKALLGMHFGNKRIFNENGWLHIVNHHEGQLPLSIKAVPEGTPVGTHNVLMTVENTCPQCYWLTNYMETLLVETWYPITVATQSREIKKNILRYLVKNGDPAGIMFKLHDFGFRGVSSPESAAWGGAAHLVNFMGTDTLAALLLLRDYYDEPCAGFSIPASEHSTMASWGRDNEAKAMENMLDQFEDCPLLACVSDTYNIFEACSDIWGGKLRDKVLNRKGTLVVRPDSGDPAKVILEVLIRLGQAFGYTKNQKGYKVLDPHVRVIQGDGVNLESINEILRQMDQMDWSADNIAFGMGGALLQKLNRDTQRMAFKCSFVSGITSKEFHDIPWKRDVYKDPVTDPGKVSKRGRLKLLKDVAGHLYTTLDHVPGEDQLVEVFRDGQLLVKHKLSDIREKAAV